MKRLSLFLFFITVLVINIPVMAEFDVTGELESSISVVNVDNEDDYLIVFNQNLGFDFYLPFYSTSSAKINLDITKSSVDQKVQVDFSKLYLSYYPSAVNIKIGRQPLGWSFGSFINPVDFNLQHLDMGLEKDTEGAVDAVVVKWAVGNLSNLSSVFAVAGGRKLKGALRGRTNAFGVDLMANYVQDPYSRRVGLAFKADVEAGIYGGISAIYDNGVEFEDGKVVYVAGVDYSFNTANYQKLIIQIEYLQDQTGLIQPRNIGDELGILNLNYSIDDFSSVRAGFVYNIDDESQAYLGSYSRILDEGLEVEIAGVLLNGEQQTQFANPFLPDNSVSATFKYIF